MSRPYSDDLRSRAVAAVEGGLSRHRAAKLFSVGVSSVIRWVQQHHRTGSVSPKPMGGSRGVRIAGADRDWLLARIASKPDLTLEEMRRELAERGLAVGHGTVWRFCDREGLTFKKNSARRPAGSAGRRCGAGVLASAAADARSQAPGVHRRNLGQGQYGQAARPLGPRAAAPRQGSPRALADDHLRRRPPLPRHDRAHGAGRADQRRLLPGLR